MIATELLQFPAGHPNAQPVGPRGKARQTADLATGGAVGVERRVRQALREFAAAIPKGGGKGRNAAGRGKGRDVKFTVTGAGAGKGLCRDFNNKGRCPRGKSCKYAHQCENCGSWEHGWSACPES